MKKNFTSQDVEKVIGTLNGYLDYLKFKWNQENENSSYWIFGKEYLTKVSNFITKALDETIRLVENLIPGGENKKLAVMTTMEKILDFIIIQTFPVWAKPFSSVVKSFVLNVLIDNFIDFIVSKYNAGLWKDQAKEETNSKEEEKILSNEIFVPPVIEVPTFEKINLQEAKNGKPRRKYVKKTKKS